ncbi:PstS family phosphate ABC transporter substrate-binding protein [Mycobacterium sp. IDR2000157661]|uniref:PstS family phosphate ABC transporter substrate-binding protein n=1 Tax=Mycobacterium sp. IDR2000157661 TaxID=2867005 RepID=UPI001EE9D873|nr:PstS family phosphate ABC transporter substrate-binding protein [Mycobacterium sp. IDR2000157661]ULE31267.1 PstS family phosphate ABC transporter substrate-binding protein [Mycobacterium sp. IDR2000157661]
MKLRHRPLAAASLLTITSLALAACGGGDQPEAGGDGLSGDIIIDGSSTVAPLTEAIAAMFQQEHPDVRVSVGTSGTGGGFEKFCNGETAISDASRQISQEEVQACEQAGIQFDEITVANDALTVVVNPENPVNCVSPEQLQAIYGPRANATNWNQVPGIEPAYDQQLQIFSPGADSGTFDYFTEAVNGEEGAQRSQGVNIVGEDDNATVTGVSGSAGGIGYFGYSFFAENKQRLKALEIRNEAGECVAPTPENTQNKSYNPLGRQLYIYPSARALEQREVQEFVNFYLDNVNDVAQRVGFIALTEQQLQEARDKVASLTG